MAVIVMIPYIICYAVLVTCLIAGLALGKVRTAALVAFVPMFYLIAARGLVGVDSAFYVQQFDVIRYQGFLGGGFEPGFSILVELMTYVFSDSFNILIFLGCSAAALILVAALILEREPILFLSLTLPFFLFDMTMNGVRYGLAFAIVALGVAGLIVRRRWLFILGVVVASTIQISSVLLAAGVWVLIEARPRTFLTIALLGSGLLYRFGGYLGEKAAQNADLVAAGGFSGVLPLLITFITLVAIFLANGSHWKNIAIPVLGLALFQTVAFVFSRFYYAGLRTQSIVVFMTYLVFVLLIHRHRLNIAKNRYVLTLLLIVCAASSLLRLKNFNDEQSIGLSPFAPYYFSSEVIA